jgi:hypothetical protein
VRDLRLNRSTSVCLFALFAFLLDAEKIVALTFATSLDVICSCLDEMYCLEIKLIVRELKEVRLLREA